MRNNFLYHVILQKGFHMPGYIFENRGSISKPHTLALDENNFQYLQKIEHVIE